MPYPREGDGLGLRAGLSGSRRDVTKTARPEPAQGCKGDREMRKVIVVLILGLGVVAASSLPRYSVHVAAAQPSTAVFDADGKLKLPEGYRHWVFVGAP